MKIVILAGGGGTRLWPLSRESKPKQFSKILGDKTMFEQTVDRFIDEYAFEDIYVCLGKNLLDQARELVPQIPEENYIVEPEKRDTAPAMGLVAAYLATKFPDEPFVYVPADHFIGDELRFLKFLRKADQLIGQTGKMVDIAIQPNFPSTVLGYTKVGKRMDASNGIEVYEFLGHKEKPDFDTAKEYVGSGDYLWHANYYMWTPKKVLQAFKLYSPGHYFKLEQIKEAYQEKNQVKVDGLFMEMEKISFDYAVTEKMDPSEVSIIKGDFGWSDVGAFDVLYDAQKSTVDASSNVVLGNHVGEETSECLIYGNDKKLIATIGLSDLVIVDQDDVLMICPKGKAEDVKKIVQKMKSKNITDCL